MCNQTSSINHGFSPVNIKWSVVRGDSASLRIDFLENDESTHFSTLGWTYKATAYDPSGDFLDSLSVVPGDGFVTINASPSVTSNWGNTFTNVVAELTFDLQVKMTNQTPHVTWTPVVGTICVYGDVTPAGI